MNITISIKQISKYLLMFTIIVSSLLNICVTTHSADNKVVRVGIFDFPGYYDINDLGVRYGYGYDYLFEIAKHTGFEYEFVYDDWQNLLGMLERGEIDLLDSAQFTEERRKIYNFSAFPTITTYEVLFTRADNEKLNYNDFESINGCTVGFVKKNLNNEYYAKFQEEKNFKTVNIEFNNISEMNEALQNGTIDVASMNNLLISANRKEIARFAPVSFYLITPNNNVKLMEEINAALEHIHTNKLYFKTKLFKRYYEDAETKINFSNEEKEFIAAAPIFTMVYDPAWAPFEYYDEKIGTVGGINSEIITMITERSGLNFKFVHTESYEEAIESVGTGKVDFLMSFDANIGKARTLGMTLSDIFISPPFALIGLEKTITPDKVIALPRVYVTAEEYARKMFSQNKIVIYENIYDCYKAILEGKADYTFENLHVAVDILKHPEYSKLSVIYVTSLKDSFAVAARSDMNPMVIEILNKSIASITPDQIESIVYNHSLNKSENDVTISKVFEKYKVTIMLSVIFFGLTVICIAGYIIIMQKKNEKTLWNIAYIDELTGISNLKKFKIDVEDILVTGNGADYEIVRFDIKDFKIINDMFTFEEGNKVLLNLVQVVKNLLLPNELFARIAGDNFILLLKHNDNMDITTNPNRILEDFDKIQKEQKTVYSIDFAVGVYRIKKDDSDVTLMLDKVTMAHKLAKHRENNTIIFYNDEIRDNALREKDIENKMLAALENGEFKVFLQPKYTLFKGNIVGAEALVRWQQNSGVMVYPNDFIPLFEKNGFILQLDIYMLNEACLLLKKWISLGIKPVPISVNFSRNHLKNENFVQEILAIVKKHEIEPNLIEVELTENAMLGNEILLQEIVKQLHNEGLTFSMDDFGTGYSSLGLLKDIPIDVIKLDKSFFDRCSDDKRGRTVIASIIDMAKKLDITTVAEGVETKENIDFLQEIGHEIMVQGYYFAKPMKSSQFEELLRVKK